MVSKWFNRTKAKKCGSFKSYEIFIIADANCTALVSKIQSNLDKYKWLGGNWLKVSVTKTKYIIINYFYSEKSLPKWYVSIKYNQWNNKTCL